MHAGHFDEAVEDYRKVLAAAPNDESARAAVEAGARQRESRGQTQQAAELYRELEKR